MITKFPIDILVAMLHEVDIDSISKRTGYKKDHVSMEVKSLLDKINNSDNSFSASVYIHDE